MKSGGYVYIMASGPMGTLYVGSTSDLVGRVWQHKHKEIPGFSAEHGTHTLVYFEWHDSLKEMVLRERQIKKWNRAWKLRLIIRTNPQWRDLYNDVLVGAGYSPVQG
ncbi:GIY-YIG nuclease family protein [bacterium]|nr:GIY-YIG nuclease family protein [bacterium]